MTTAKRPSVKIGLIILAYVAFIALGMPDGLLGVGWPNMRAGFNLPLDSLGYLLFASTAGYLTASLLAGTLLRKLGVGGLLAASCGLTGVALFSYTLVPTWWMMVVLGLFGGLGAGAIDVGLNTYVAAHFTSGLMQWLHASYGVGVTIGPLLMTYGLATLSTWRFGYRAVALFQILLAICFAASIRMWGKKSEQTEDGSEKKITEYRTSYGETFKRPEVWLSMLLFMIYVGIEMGLGNWAYTLLTESRGIDTKLAGFWAGSFYGLFTIGRITAGFYSKKFSINNIVIASILGAIAGAGLLWWNTAPVVSLIGVVLIGFSIAPIFPSLTSGTAKRVGERYAANTIGMQMAACGLGGALLPSLMGVLGRRLSLEAIPVFLFILLVCLLVIFLLSENRSRQLEKTEAQTVGLVEAAK